DIVVVGREENVAVGSLNRSEVNETAGHTRLPDGQTAESSRGEEIVARSPRYLKSPIHVQTALDRQTELDRDDLVLVRERGVNGGHPAGNGRKRGRVDR